MLGIQNFYLLKNCQPENILEILVIVLLNNEKYIKMIFMRIYMKINKLLLQFIY